MDSRRLSPPRAMLRTQRQQRHGHMERCSERNVSSDIDVSHTPTQPTPSQHDQNTQDDATNSTIPKVPYQPQETSRAPKSTRKTKQDLRTCISRGCRGRPKRDLPLCSDCILQPRHYCLYEAEACEVTSVPGMALCAPCAARYRQLYERNILCESPGCITKKVAMYGICAACLRKDNS
jgi:hypothetical protein